MYYEVMIKFEKVNYLKSEQYISAKNKRQGFFVIGTIIIIVFNIIYRYVGSEEPDGKTPFVTIFDMAVLTIPFICEYIIFGVAWFRIYKISKEYG